MAAESVPLTRDVTIKVDYCAILLTSLSPFGISKCYRKNDVNVVVVVVFDLI